MKQLLLFSFLLISFAGFAQTKSMRGYTPRTAQFSDTTFTNQGSTGTSTLQQVYNLFGIANKLNISDTSFIHGQIVQLQNAKLNIADTSLIHAQIAQTVAAIATKLNISDTSILHAQIAQAVAAIAANTTAIGGKADALAPTAIKTTSYTAAANDFVKTDATSGTVAITLPVTPADKTRVGVKMIAVSGTNTTTIAAGGSAVFNKAAGSTTATLTLLNQAVTLQYEAATAIWSVISSDVPLSQLDTRYAATLVSGTNIKTINGTSIVGSGNIAVSGASVAASDTATLNVHTTPFYNTVYGALSTQNANTAAISNIKATPNGLTVFGNSIGAATGASSTGSGDYAVNHGFAYLLKNRIGGMYLNYAKPGDQAADMSYRWVIANSNPLGNGTDPVYVTEVGTNDVTTYNTNTDKQTIFKRAELANLAWLAIPAGNKRFGQAFTLSGFTADNTIQNGLGVTSTANGNTATGTITTVANSAIYVWYLIRDGNTGTFTVSIDGVAQSDTYTASTTFNAFGDNSAIIATQNSTTSAIACVRLPVAGAGGHTVVVTNTSTGTVTLYGIGTTPNLTPSSANPYVYAISPNHQNNANDALSGTYAGFVSSLVATVAADGLNVNYVDTRSALGTNYATYYSDLLHPNNAGHALMDSTIASAIPAAKLVGNTLPNTAQPTQNYVASSNINPSQFASPNAYNQLSTTAWNPGIRWGYNNGNMYGTYYNPNTGITNFFPNTGGTVGWSVGKYLNTNGLPPSAIPTTAELYMAVTSNGAVKFFTNGSGVTSTMNVQNNAVVFGGETTVSNSINNFFANTYNTTSSVATSGGNFNSGTLWFRCNLWNSTAGTFDDIGFRNAPAPGANPNTYLTLLHANGGSGLWGIDLSGATAPTKLGKVNYTATNTATGTTGNQTINNPSGTVNIAAAGTSVTVTNSLVTASSIVMAVVRTADANKPLVASVVPGSGSFVINLSTAPAAEVSIGFIVYN